MNVDIVELAPGDVTICIRCGGWHIFTEELQLRRFEPEDLNGVDDEMLAQMRRVTTKIKGSR